MESIWKERKVSMHITEYARRDFADIVGKYNRFVVTSQFDKEPQHIDELNFPEGYGLPKQYDEPQLGHGQFLFGVEEDGTLTKLKSIIDSSD